MSAPTAPKPAPCPVRPENIPVDIKSRPQWVCWRWTWREATRTAAGKWDKPPFDARTGRHASTTNSDTWCSFGEAHAAYMDPDNKYDGIGYAFSGAPDDVVGVDLDDCRDPQTGQILLWAPEQRACEQWATDAPDPHQIIDSLPSYAEISPSGTGVKLFVRGSIPQALKHGSVEIYCWGRYFTVTGHKLANVPATIADCGSTLASIYGQFDAKAKDLPDTTTLPDTDPSRLANSSAVFSTPSVDEVISACSRATNGDKFLRLFAGDISGYSSQSEAELALCGLIAFWANRNTALVDQVFRQSKLYRDKWDQLRGEHTYGRRTIAKAIERCTETYKWSRRKPPAIYTVGDLVLQIAGVRATSTKLIVAVEVLRNGQAIDRLRLTEAASCRRHVAGRILDCIGRTPDAAAKREVDGVLGQIFVTAADSQARSQNSKTVHDILAEFIPGAARLQYRLKGGRAYSASLREDISKAKFVELFTTTEVLKLAEAAVDAPRDDCGAIKRRALIAQVTDELRVIWGDLNSTLKSIASADIAVDSPAAICYRQTIASLFSKPVTMGILKHPLARNETVQVAQRGSLASSVRRLVAELPGDYSRRWHRIHDGYDAYFREFRGPTAGEYAVVLAMRFELGQQVGVTIPDTSDQTDLKDLGQKFGAIDPEPPVSDRMTGGGRLAVLSRSLTNHIMALPADESEASSVGASDTSVPASDTDIGGDDSRLSVAGARDGPLENGVSDTHGPSTPSLDERVTSDDASLPELRRLGEHE